MPYGDTEHPFDFDPRDEESLRLAYETRKNEEALAQAWSSVERLMLELGERQFGDGASDERSDSQIIADIGRTRDEIDTLRGRSEQFRRFRTVKNEMRRIEANEIDDPPLAKELAKERTALRKALL